jgi:16S rRNA (cytidine1402-2'-O)-methyltransferase
MVYLIPSELYEGVVHTLPGYLLDAVKKCQVFFVENERTARRFLKRIWHEMVIDDYGWVSIHKAEEAVLKQFEAACKAGKTIGILSEAGCPGIADPGQILVGRAQALGVKVMPLVGPSSVLLALMASGLNGQSFRFCGYLPIEAQARKKSLQQLEDEVWKQGATQIFIETPYRNEALFKQVLDTCRNETLLCVAASITHPDLEKIFTKSIGAWKKEKPPALHKIPVIFLLGKPL